MEIHEDIHSDSKKLFTFQDSKHSKVEGLMPFESEEGFYIRARKPTNRGIIKFVYGVYQVSETNSTSNRKNSDIYISMSVLKGVLMTYLSFVSPV